MLGIFGVFGRVHVIPDVDTSFGNATIYVIPPLSAVQSLGGRSRKVRKQARPGTLAQ